MTTEPRTEAGRALLNRPLPNWSREHFLAAILAIEAEAALPVPALAARIALILEAHDHEPCEPDILKADIRDALSALALPVPALDALRPVESRNVEGWRLTHECGGEPRTLLWAGILARCPVCRWSCELAPHHPNTNLRISDD